MLKIGHAGGLLGACGGGIGGGGVGSIGAGKIGNLPPLNRQRAFPQPLNRTNSFSILEPFIASISGMIKISSCIFLIEMLCCAK